MFLLLGVVPADTDEPREPAPPDDPDVPPATLQKSAEGSPDGPLLMIEVRGARAMSPEIYRAVAAIGQDERVDERSRSLAEKRIRQFLSRAGYELAAVSVSVVADEHDLRKKRLVAEIDEGRLGKLIYRGAGSFRTLQLQLEFALPELIFNRPMLDRRLQEMSERYGIRSYRYLLVPGDAGDSGGFIEELSINPRLSLIRPGEAYDLHVLLEPEAWETGLKLSAEVDAEGLAGGMLYRSTDFLIDETRWELEALVGAKLGTGLVDRQLRVLFSRATLEAGWLTPPLSGTTLRGRAAARGAISHRKRADLDLERYFRTRTEGLAALSWEAARGLELELGFGAELSTRFSTRQKEGATTELPDARGRTIRAFSELRMTLVLDPDELRRDMRHRISAKARAYRDMAAADITAEARARWDKMLSFGWHELRMGLAGTWLFGPIAWPDEEPLGDHLRGVFGDLLFTRKVASATLDLRISLARDVFKLGVFHDGAVYAELDSTRTDESLGLANSFGAGGHLLILDAFQLSAFYAFGFSRHGRFDHGFAAVFEQAF